jgi:nucleotide-binding universal stress UspA family protein
MAGIPGPRVIVGMDGSYGSLAALRYGVAEAARRGCELMLAHAVQGLVPHNAWPAERERARARMTACLHQSLGGPPPGLRISYAVLEYVEPGPGLAHLAAPDDLLVVGGGRSSRRAWWWRPGTDTYCVRHARCPVIVVPPPALLDLVRTARRRRDLRRSLDQLSTAPAAGR